MSEAADKARIRAIARTARQSIPDDVRATLSAAACKRAFELTQVARAVRALGFAAAPEELDLALLLTTLRAAGVEICLPRIASADSLTLHACSLDAELEGGPFGLRQPTATTPQVASDGIDLVIVPGVAFDATGARLGFGGGYYDRLLATMPHAFRIALAFDEQLVDVVPTQAHDQRVDAIVTPTRTLMTAWRD
ncbi:MAG: 5-formyltetrahydrofolate cyclo-ligase [Actinobacteria bacterium]|nr:5-formyltetrahydrofolate cyclo-ligase [Actinomycetota bacterium]MCG2806660.1 5-formyltetrahydrofolate cyclo-ligase [Coriobacteriia bacterium]